MTTYSNVTKYDYMSLVNAAKKGPVVIGIDASDPYFKSYTTGVLRDTYGCKQGSTKLTMFVTIVGIVQCIPSDSGSGYCYKFKNQMGKSWG